MPVRNYSKSESWARDLKEKLQFRGFTVVQSSGTNGYPKLTLGSAAQSIEFFQEDAISKDIFGSDLLALSPHGVNFASRVDGTTTLEASKIMLELSKLGVAITVKSHADTLATAEAAVGDKLSMDIRWPTKGQ